MKPSRIYSCLSAVSLLALAGLLSGCATTPATSSSTPIAAPTPTPTPTPTPPPYIPPVGNYQGGLFTGQVLAGVLPVVGATVQLYAAGTAGNGSAGTQLLSTGMTTDATGSFSETVAYTCPYDISVLYLVASGGHVGSGSDNAGIALMSSPGTCVSISGTPKFVINEVTTAASAYSFAQFLSAGGKLGSTSTNSSGIRLAAGTLANLVDIYAGTSPGADFPALGNPPVKRIHSLANAVHACVASTGTAATACTGLYSAATVSGTAPGNTLDALINIAQNPGTNVSDVYTVSTSDHTFSPALDVPPNDWTMFVTYAGGGMNDPASVSIDSQGRVWVSNFFSVASLFSNTGSPVLPSGVTGNNLFESYGAAVDANDNFWVANQQSPSGLNGGLGSITVLNPSGQMTATYSAGGLNFPTGIAFDTSNTAWIVDYGNIHLTLLNASGTPLSGSEGYTDDSFIFPVAVAVDSKRNGYVANQSSNTVVKVSADGKSFTPFACCTGASGVAVDGSDNVWVANYYGDSIGLISAAGQILSGGGFVGGGIAHPQGIAVDGAGKAWVANYRGPSLSELAPAGSAQPGRILSPDAGWGADAMYNGDHALLEAFGLAIDASGNLWVSSFGNNTLTEFVGMATPVKTPLLGPVRVP